MKWSEVKKILTYEPYKLGRKAIPEEHMDFLYRYLGYYAAHAMNECSDASEEAKWNHFIASMLIVICRLLDNVRLEVEEAVDAKSTRTGILSSFSREAKIRFALWMRSGTNLAKGKCTLLLVAKLCSIVKICSWCMAS